jgi:hypothetical protein
MSARIIAAAAVVAALAVSACGSDGGSSAGVAPQTAKSTVERAAHLKLDSVKVPADARDEGLLASYSNAATAVKDEQIVGLFVMKDAKVADKVSEMVRSSAPRTAKLIVKDEVMVVYAAAGTDHTAAVERAVWAL